MAAAPASPPLSALLAEEVKAVEGFLNVLKQEEAALVAADLDKLLVLVARKGECSTALNALVERRENAQRASGKPPGRAGMDAWVASLGGSSGEAAKWWAKLLALAERARSQNEINGKLITLHFQHNQRALATLMAEANRAMTYSADGHQHSGGIGRLLGSA